MPSGLTPQPAEPSAASASDSRAGGDAPSHAAPGRGSLPRTTLDLTPSPALPSPRSFALPDAQHPARRDHDGEQVIQTAEATTPGKAGPLDHKQWTSRAAIAESIDLRDDEGDRLHIDVTYRLEQRPAEIGELPDLWIHTERKALLTIGSGEHAGATIVGQARIQLAPDEPLDPKAAIGRPSQGASHWAQIFLAEAQQFVNLRSPGGAASLRADAAGDDVLAYEDPLRMLVGLKRVLKQRHVAGHGGDVARRQAIGARLRALADRGGELLEREIAAITSYHEPHPGRVAPVRFLLGDIDNWLADNERAGRDDTEQAGQLHRARERLASLLDRVAQAHPAHRDQVVDALDAPVRFLERTAQGAGEGIAMAVDAVVLGVDAIGQATGLGTFDYHPISKYGHAVEVSGSNTTTALVTMVNGFADEWTEAIERAKHGDYRSLSDVSLDTLMLIDGARTGGMIALDKAEAVIAKIGRVSRTARALVQTAYDGASALSGDARAMAAAMADGADAFVARVRAGGMQMAASGGGGGAGGHISGGGLSGETLIQAAKAAKAAFHDARSAAHAGGGEQAAQQAARSAAGNAATNATKKYKFDAVERLDAENAMRTAATEAAERAYREAIGNGGSSSQANTAANKAAKVAAEQAAKQQAEHAAVRTATRSIEGGGTLDTQLLDPQSQGQLDSYQKGTTASHAKRLAFELDGLGPQELLAKMSREPCTCKTVGISGPPPQLMHVYEYPDGTVIRYKPLGDMYRQAPTYSVEVKRDPALPDLDRESTAFKLDPSGHPLPKGPYEIKNPYPEGSFQADVFEREVMNAGHRTLRQ